MEISLKALQQPIAFHRVFAKVAGCPCAGLFLSQAFYWQNTRDDDEWFWKTSEQWEEETVLSEKQQRTARKKLESIGVLEVQRRGCPAKNYYRINKGRLASLINQQIGQKAKLEPPKGQTRSDQREEQDLTKGRNILYTENTTENTAESKSTREGNSSSKKAEWKVHDRNVQIGEASRSILPSQPSKAKSKSLGTTREGATVPREVLQGMVDMYNELKPSAWSMAQFLGSSRARRLTAFAKEYGDRTFEIWENALRYASQDKWCVTHNLSLENFLTNNKPVQYSERYANRNIGSQATPENLKRAELRKALIEAQQEMKAEAVA